MSVHDSVENSAPVDGTNTATEEHTPNTVTDENHDVKYDDMQDAMHEAIAPSKSEEERDNLKAQEEKQAKRIARIARLKEKDLSNSIAWCIGDAPGYMVLLQVIVACVCALSCYCSYIQFQPGDLDENNQCFGPYYVQKDGVSYRCGWPKTNIIMGLIAPGIGFISAVILLIITLSIGRKLQKSIKTYNELHFPSQDDKGVEYYEIYNACYFKFIRRIISACAYLQLISFGLDLARYEMGKEHAQKEFGVASETASKDLQYNFQAPLIMGLFVAIALRVSHDAIWIPLKKKVYRLNCVMSADTTYTTTTREKEEAVVMHIDPNASTVDGNERYMYAQHPLSVRSGRSGHGVYLPSAPHHYAHSVVSGHGVEYQYAPSVDRPTHGEHVKGSTVIYVNKTATN
eukprot:243581_1